MEDQNPKIHWYKGSDGKPGLRKDRVGLAAEAKKLLSGRVKWQPTWKTLGKKYDGAVDSAASR
jgi:hypothetical protein